MKHPSSVFVGFLLAVALTWPAFAWAEAADTETDEPASAAEAADEGFPTVAEKTTGMKAYESFLRLWEDRAGGKIWLEVPPPDGQRGLALELLWVEGLRTGLGSNPVGLDRSQLGPTRWLALRRLGPRVLLEQLNPGYRANSERYAERRAARESFATSVLWAGDVAALDDDGRALVDFTGFLVRDAHDIAVRLDQSDQGSFKLDPARSAIEFDESLAFQDNVELEVLLTYGGSNPGNQVRQTAPSPESLTFVLHHSFVRLPDDSYRPRAFDSRAGSFAIAFRDYGTALDAPVQQRRIARHRLQKTDPSAASSAVRRPIVFYVDPGVPEPVRSALVDGASWWADAFDAVGFEDGFRVEILPGGAHPLDVRYNVIQWVHRSTRGWSYGGGVIDPRTGEILKGHVLLGSLRVRQDRLLFEGLVGTEKTGSGDDDDPIQLALARIRQLAAHEVGHALGFTHNFAASTYAGRASVMDYPAPLIGFDGDGELDLSRAYGVGVGAWDRHALRYAYGEFAPDVDEQSELGAIVLDGIRLGYTFLTDDDARPAGASDPRANLWDNGNDPIAALTTTLRVREHALRRFGARNVAPGTPLAHLEEVLATLYFHHRFQLDAALKVIGGMEYSYALRGDGQLPTRIVPAADQRRALDTTLGLLDARTLDIDPAIVSTLAPRPFGEGRNREMFASGTAPAFDLQGAVAAAAAQVIDGLLQRERLGRLVEQHRRNPDSPGVDEVLGALVEQVFRETSSPEGDELQRLIQSVLVERMFVMARDVGIRPTIRARIESTLRTIGPHARREAKSAQAQRYARYISDEIDRFLARPADTVVERWSPPERPPGSPIGSMAEAHGRCGWPAYPSPR